MFESQREECFFLIIIVQNLDFINIVLCYEEYKVCKKGFSKITVVFGSENDDWMPFLTSPLSVDYEFV